MNSLELVNELYKPYKITKLGNVTILESMEGKFVVKQKSKKDVKELFDYLKHRGFVKMPKIVDDSRSDVNIYEYVDDVKYPNDQKAIDMIRVVAELHSKTSYEKEVREDKYKEIYDGIKENLMYFREQYTDLTQEIEGHIFMSPSEYLFIRNSSKLLNQIGFCLERLDNWYDNVKSLRSTRVSVVHNNLEMNHFRAGNEALISWDKAKVDTPVLDIYNFYQKEALNLEFSSILSEYFKHYDLEPMEKELLFILLCMPKKFTLEGDEISNVQSVGDALDYSFKTEYLVRPYYVVDNPEQ